MQALIQGVTTLVLTDEEDNNYVIEVFVKGDTRHLQAVIDNRFPDSAVEAYKIQDNVALTGWVAQRNTSLRSLRLPSSSIREFSIRCELAESSRCS